MYGWTMSYKWGHPVATLPVTNGTIRHTHSMTEILRISSRVASESCQLIVVASISNSIAVDEQHNHKLLTVH